MTEDGGYRPFAGFVGVVGTLTIDGLWSRVRAPPLLPPRTSETRDPTRVHQPKLPDVQIYMYKMDVYMYIHIYVMYPAIALSPF